MQVCPLLEFGKPGRLHAAPTTLNGAAQARRRYLLSERNSGALLISEGSGVRCLIVPHPQHFVPSAYPSLEQRAGPGRCPAQCRPRQVGDDLGLWQNLLSLGLQHGSARPTRPISRAVSRPAFHGEVCVPSLSSRDGCGWPVFHSVEFLDLSGWAVAEAFVDPLVVEPGDVLNHGELELRSGGQARSAMSSVLKLSMKLSATALSSASPTVPIE